MEGGVRSGGVLKKKSSSGCLIIKKKVESGNSGAGDLKRARLVGSDSGPSDGYESFEFMRRKVNDKRLLQDGAMGCSRNSVGVKVGSGERKRSRVDSYEFDEYGEFDGRRMRNEYAGDRLRTAGIGGSDNSVAFGVGSSHRNLAVGKQKQGSYYDGSGIGRRGNVGFRRGSDIEEDESQMPTSLLRMKYQEMSDEPIRLQGKNGVLKVMVNKKKRMDLHSHHKKYDPREDVLNLKKDMSPPLPLYPSYKPPENRGLLVDRKEKTGVRLEKVKHALGRGVKVRESVTAALTLDIKDRGLETDATDTALKLAPPGAQICSPKKRVKKEEDRTPSEIATPIKGRVKEANEGKAKRGGSTEKQMLREKIRGMLLDSGWTIDYRPRRNRDYLDAVYINPGGTAYWSIIKAYDALKKQLDEDGTKAKAKVNVGSPSFAPLSEDLINKLTRQTKKKIEEEMKRKRTEDVMTKRLNKRSSGRDSGESSDSEQNEERLGSYSKQTNYMSQKGKLVEAHRESDDDDDMSDDSPKRNPKQFKAEKPCGDSKSNVVQGRTSKVIGRCTLLVRGSDKGGNMESDGYVRYSGKRTVLAWLVDSGKAHLSEKVQYMNRRRSRVMLEGWITRDGIHCGCCSKILTVSKFELHAGSKLRQPFQNIFLESGDSLLQCQIEAWNKQGESVRRGFHTVDVDGDDPDDDTCGICGDGGALICCDSCPSTFHPICLEIQMLPSGDWHCPNCICKFCGDAAEGNDSAADELIRCRFCEKKYHESCGEEVPALPMSSSGVSFCGLKCQELYDHFQKILGVKHELDGGFSWSFVQRADVSDTLHCGFSQRVESNSKLAVALSVMNECFLPIFDRRSGINIVHNVVYNCKSNFNRLNYFGFYTAILERGDEIVSAASIRIHGTCLAEMPFIATREMYRRQGMCRRLLSAIETELHALKVEKLIIPAIPEHRNTWTTVFGFHLVEDGLKREIKSINMLVFPGTDMLQKQLVNQEVSGGMNLSVSMKKQPQSPVLLEKSNTGSPVEHDKLAANDFKVCHDGKTSDKVSDLDYPPAPPSNDSSAASASDSLCENRIEPEKNKTQNTSASDSAEFAIHAVERMIADKEPAVPSTFPNGQESAVKQIDEMDHETVTHLPNDLIVPGNVTKEAVDPSENDKCDAETVVIDGKSASISDERMIEDKEPARPSTFPNGQESAVKQNDEMDRETVTHLPNDLIVPGDVTEEAVDPSDNDRCDTETVVDENSASISDERMIEDKEPVMPSTFPNGQESAIKQLDEMDPEPVTHLQNDLISPGKVTEEAVEPDENDKCDTETVEVDGKSAFFSDERMIKDKEPAMSSTFPNGQEGAVKQNDEMNPEPVTHFQNDLIAPCEVTEEAVEPAENDKCDSETVVVDGKAASISSSEVVGQNMDTIENQMEPTDSADIFCS